MMDVIYGIATLFFFALMLAFVKGCDRLGQSADVERVPRETR